jgi:hypothetical protein
MVVVLYSPVVLLTNSFFEKFVSDSQRVALIANTTPEMESFVLSHQCPFRKSLMQDHVLHPDISF